MSAPVSTLKIEKAEADGNCAFNAFALVLCTDPVLSRLNLPDDNQFVVEASRLLNITPTSWTTLKKVLSDPETSRSMLQKVLAPLLRSLSIDSVINNPIENQKHTETTLEPLLGEFTNYLILKNDPAQPKLNSISIGDIFYRHRFIRNKFAELQQHLPSSTEAVLAVELANWWENTGHKQFLINTRQPKIFAGDIELAQLGKYFGLNIFIESHARGMHNVQIYHANGCLTPALEAILGLKSELVNRHIAEFDNAWVTLTGAELIKRLSAVPQFDEVAALLKTAPKKNTPLPATINDQTREELFIRGIIDKTKQVFAMNINPDYAMPRLQELAQKDQVIEAWKATYTDSPAVYLQNENAMHWNAIHKPRDSKPITTYQLSEGEKDVNDAINKIYDVLNDGNPPLDDKVIKENFEKAFDELSVVLKNFQEKRIDFGLFKQKKEAIVTEVQQKVLTHKM